MMRLRLMCAHRDFAKYCAKLHYEQAGPFGLLYVSPTNSNLDFWSTAVNPWCTCMHVRCTSKWCSDKIFINYSSSTTQESILSFRYSATWPFREWFCLSKQNSRWVLKHRCFRTKMISFRQNSTIFGEIRDKYKLFPDSFDGRAVGQISVLR